MQQLITLIHIFTSLCVIGLVLIQRGKGTDLSASYMGGASSTMFGSQGSTPFLIKLTGILALIFFLTSASLSFLVGKNVNSSVLPGSQQSIENLNPPGSMQKIPTSPMPVNSFDMNTSIPTSDKNSRSSSK